MKYWRILMILYDTESQINFVAKMLEEMDNSSLTEGQLKEIKEWLSNNELTLAKVWEQIERIEAK